MARRLSGRNTVSSTAKAQTSIPRSHSARRTHLRKGFRRHIDSYSAFLENDHATPTGLAGYFRERGLARLFLCGLAYDFCVRYSAIDGKALGFETIVIEDACRSVNLPASVSETNAALAAAGIPRIQSAEILRHETPRRKTTVARNTGHSYRLQVRVRRRARPRLRHPQQQTLPHHLHLLRPRPNLHRRVQPRPLTLNRALTFPITYNPLAPQQNSKSAAQPITKTPLFAIGVAGSVILSLIWLAMMRGCH